MRMLFQRLDEIAQMNSSPLASSLAERPALKDQLLRSFPELGDDEQALLDTLDGISDLDEQIALVMRDALDRETQATALQAMIDAWLVERIEPMKARVERLNGGAKTRKNVVFNAMQTAGMRNLKLPDMTLSIGRGKAKVVITDEAALPDDMMRIKREPDKLAIATELMNGRAVEGAMLGNPQAFLTVHRK